MTSTSDRVLASVVCLLIGAICFAGKAAAFGIFALTATAILHGQFQTKSSSAVVKAPMSLPFGLVLMFTTYAGLSSIWALAPQNALHTAAALSATALAVVIIVYYVHRWSPTTTQLVGGWHIVGYLVGCTLLLVEILTDFTYTKIFINIVGSDVWWGSMVLWSQGQAVNVQQHVANWGVAAVNLLAWPTIFLAKLSFGSRTSAIVLMFLIGLVSAATFSSVHTTSMVIIPVSALIFLLARYHYRSAMALLLAGTAAAFLLVVPFSQASLHRWQFDKASWAHESLQARFIIWGYTADQVAAAPWFGIGAQSTPTWKKLNIPDVKVEEGKAYPLSTSTHAHNNFLEIWFELGFFGALLAAAAVIGLLSSIDKLRRETAPYAVATATACLLMSAATWSIWSPWLYSTYGLALVLIVLGDHLSAMRGTSAAVSFADIAFPRLLRRVIDDEKRKDMSEHRS